MGRSHAPGDTLARGAEVLVPDVVSREFWERPDAPRPPDVVRHILARHTDAAEVGRVADEAGVSTPVLTHDVPTEGPRGPTDDQRMISGSPKSAGTSRAG